MTNDNQPLETYVEADTIKEAARNGQYEEVDGQPTPMLTGQIDAEDHEDLDYGKTVNVSQAGVEVMAQALYDEGAVEVDPAETTYSGIEGPTKLEVDSETVEEVYEAHKDGFSNIESASAALSAAVEAVGAAFEQTYEGPATVTTPNGDRKRDVFGFSTEADVSEPAMEETARSYGEVAFVPVEMQQKEQDLEQTAEEELEPATEETQEDSGGLRSKLGF
jgi:hypothetical protein